MTQDFKEHKVPKFHFRITQGLLVGLVLLVGLIIGTSFLVIWVDVRPSLNEMSKVMQTKMGRNIALALERELERANAVSESIAITAATLFEEQGLDQLPKVVPRILQSASNRGVIAGGGIWPEPYIFDKDLARNSFFWALNVQNNMEKIDVYNAASGAGYHREKWYAALRVLNTSTYWSQTYIDPLSSKTMVRGAAPMLIDGQFQGVSTVELKLDGISRILRKLISGFDAYAFIVDKNNRFVVFPTLGVDVSGAQAYRNQQGFEYLSDLDKVYPSFKLISGKLREVDALFFAELASEKPNYRRSINRLVEGSYQISKGEARRLVANEWRQKKSIDGYPEPLAFFAINDDILLRGEATALIYNLPTTGWRVVTIFEQKTYGGISGIVSQKLFSTILLSSLLFGVCAFFFVKIFAINRILTLVKGMRGFANYRLGRPMDLDSKQDNELGLLAYWVNYRVRHLEEALSGEKMTGKKKSNFFIGVSKELLDPISVVWGFCRKLFIKMGGEIERENYQNLVDIHRNSSRMLNMVNDVLEMSRLDAGEASMQCDWENVDLLLDEACTQAFAHISDAGLVLKRNRLEEAITIYVDKQKIIRSLTYLLSHTADSTKEGEITLTVIREKLGYEDAIGFSILGASAELSEDAKHVMYRQVLEVDEYGEYDGCTGLGLNIVRKIATLHAGAVYFKSTEDQGSCFRMTVPVKFIDDESESMPTD